MLGQDRRVGRPLNKKRRQTWFGVGKCSVCCRKRVDGVCGCGENASQPVVGSKEEFIRLHETYDVGDEMGMCFDNAGMSSLDEELAVLRESDVEEQGDHNEDSLEEEMEGDSDVQVMEGENGLDEEMDEDLDVEVMEGNVEETEVYNSVAGLVELPEKCRNCY